MITAKEAINLNPLGRIKEYRDFFDLKIREAAKKGESSVNIRAEPYSYWLYDERKLEDLAAKEVLKELRNNGFKVKYFQYDGSQFSDYGMTISWGDNAPAAE